MDRAVYDLVRPSHRFTETYTVGILFRHTHPVSLVSQLRHTNLASDNRSARKPEAERAVSTRSKKGKRTTKRDSDSSIFDDHSRG